MVDVIERKKVAVLCVQESKWKGKKAREMGNGYKLHYTGEDGKIYSVHPQTEVLWLMKTNKAGNIICAYAPHVGCETEKGSFSNILGTVLAKIPQAEEPQIGADFNGLVG